MPYPLPLTRTEAYLAYKAGVIQQSDLKPSLAVPRNGIDAWLAYWTGLAEDYPKREDGTPHILQEEEAYIAYLCGVINEYPEKCLRRVGAYLRYLISARWGRPDHPLNREELYLSLIKTQFIPSGDPSSDIEIDGTAKAPFVDVKLYGDTAQQTYTGQNLYDVSTLQVGSAVTIDDDGWITATKDNSAGSSSSYTNIWTSNLALEPNTQYAIFLEVKEVSGTGELDITSTNSTQGQFSSWQSKQISSLTAGSTYKVTPTTKSSFSGIYGGLRTLLNLSAGQSASITFRLTVMEDTSQTVSTFSYEPYVGGQASPSPSYPQQIQTVTGEQTVTIIGKNLFDKNNASLLLDGLYVGSTTIQSSSQTASLYIPCEPNTTYTVSKDSTARFACATTAELPADGVSIADRIADSTATSITITTSSTANYLVVFYYHSSYDTKSKQQILDSIQIELGSTATAYTAYSKQTYPINLGSIELCKLGTYQDYIWKDGDSWKVHKATVKKVFDGTETWFQSGQTDASYEVGAASVVELGISTNGGAKDTSLASNFAYSTTLGGIKRPQCGFSFYNTSSGVAQYIGISLPKTTAADIDEFQDWIIANPQTVYAVLATPTNTVITNQALIDQLEALVKGGSEEGTTYIKVSTPDPNLPGLLYVEAAEYI